MLETVEIFDHHFVYLFIVDVPDELCAQGSVSGDRCGHVELGRRAEQNHKKHSTASVRRSGNQGRVQVNLHTGLFRFHARH